MLSINPIVSSSPPRTRAVALLVAGALSFCATVASAATSDSAAPQVFVHYSDLDLSKAQDAQILYRRITFAARNVCPEYASRDLWRKAAGQRCLSDTVARAVHDVNSPKLAEVEATYARRTKVG
ncbi:MAG: UrcA family protein [Gammaproteobacteria bacterium]